jgi:glutaredoxin
MLREDYPVTQESSPKIEIFTKPGCPYCAGLKQRLAQDGTPYIEHDVYADRAALQRMLTLNGGQRRVPTMVEGEQVTVGYHGA